MIKLRYFFANAAIFAGKAPRAKRHLPRKAPSFLEKIHCEFLKPLTDILHLDIIGAGALVCLALYGIGDACGYFYAALAAAVGVVPNRAFAPHNIRHNAGVIGIAQSV